MSNFSQNETSLSHVHLSSFQNSARDLVNYVATRKSLPAYAMYLHPDAASEWMQGDSFNEKAKCEGEAWIHLKFSEKFNKNQSLLMIGLGVGKGNGEIELLRKILSEGKKIYYIAIDRSQLILNEHQKILHSQLQRFLDNNQLSPFFECNEFENFPFILEKLKADVFITSPVFVTCLGNNIGNNPYCEKTLVNKIRECFALNPFGILIGISVKRYKFDYHDVQRHGIFLKTFRELLVATDSSFEKGADEICPYSFRVEIEPYETAWGVKGDIYNFTYSLSHGFRAPNGANLHCGDKITLYSIIKFNPESLKAFFEELGCLVEYHQQDNLLYDFGNGQVREQALLGIFNK